MSVDQTKLQSLTRRDPLAFGITFIDLLEEKKWEVASRAWATEIYQALNPWLIEKYPIGQSRRLIVTKSTQAGISTMALTKMFHLAVNWSVRIFYTLPRQQDVIDMVSTRVDPMISGSSFLKSKLGLPDSTHAKKVGDSYIFFMELSIEPRMMPADALFVDEVDLSNPDYMSTAQNRMDASRWKLNMFLSTPTLPNYGINALYNSSDMRQWLVKCPSCNTEQPIDWDANLRIVGPHNNPTKVFYGCASCSKELTVEHMQTGRWVAQKPELSKESVGYHIHQMLTTPAPVLYAHFKDPQTKIIEFYRKRLGMPYEIGGGSLDRDDILSTCFTEPYDMEMASDGESSYYMGVDQGNQLQVIVAKIPKNSTQQKIVKIEMVPPERGFRRISQLMEIFRVRRAVIDGNPNRHEANALTASFPARVLVADYNEQREFFKTKKVGKGYITNVTIDRTLGFDNLTASIKDGDWSIPGEPPALEPDIELLIDQATALKRDIEKRRTPSGEVEVAVWRRLRADHLAHAWLYLKTAMEIDHGKKSGRMRIIGKSEPEEEVEAEDTYKPDDETIVKITTQLAEVPKEQLEEFISKDGEEYTLPFPLSYKYSLVNDEFSTEDILWVMIKLVNAKPSKQNLALTQR